MAGSGTSDTDDDCYDTESSNGTESDAEGCFLDYGFQPQIAPSYQVIMKESLLEAQTQDLCKVMDMLTLREQHARTLLIYHRWDIERLFAVLVDKGRDQLFSEAGVTILEHKNPVSLQFSQLTCNICIEDMSPDEFTSMDCGHCFCNKCWTEHFIVKINEGQSKRIRCMEYTCKAICDEAVVRKLVNEKHPDIAERFDRFLLESFIEDNSKVKWCPSIPHCGYAIRVEGDPCCEVECACGLQFCFKCSLETHSPCSCMMWDLWSKKCLKESEAMKWIIVNTKPCPKCHKPVEKNGGCNLVTCVCGQPFCWVCGGATGFDHTYSRIIGHTCGRYKEDSINKARVDKEIYRYMHYNSRYQAHTDSFDIERKLKETIQNKISVSETNDSGSKDYSWITNGLDRLLRCRRILSYSYAFAYYMFGNDLFKDEMTRKEREMKMNLFEDQQQQLEANVERLSKYIGVPFNQSSMDKVWATRMQVINLSVVTDQICKKMYECIENDLLGPLQTVTHNIAPYKSNTDDRPWLLLK
ncbi:putative E3 ubiquitin-protein ligase ARI2 isoform X1 [Cinnamomum micranthum f. kanehirae]|uniref:RBR-type E3 ubiquitin transferase n=1 Tax=Cinnamomum micranthum f. kanehirae TaxID=337451 RepID=A0A443N6T3_9MAGN|nr:putative E3 ubiquitin-protein ligase ARI2 isoform X1 [Cinnamomum micranthum f. kanehirae]